MVLGGNLPKTGVEAVVEGMARFRRDMDDMHRRIAETGRRAQGAQGGLSAMSGGMSFLSSAAATALGTLTGFIAANVFGAIAQGMASAGAAIVNFGKDAISTAARSQELDVVLKLIGGRAGQTASQLDAQVQSIRELGIETGVAQGLLVDFYRWNLNSADATKLARLAQDAAVISQQNSSDALAGLMHGITTMNTLVLRTYGITLASTVDAQDEYAKSLGKTRDQLTENERIQAVLNAVLAQGGQIAGAYEAAMTTAGKRLRSVDRLVDDLGQNVGGPFLGAFTAGVDIITAIVKALKGLTGEGGPLKRVLDTVGGALRGFLEAGLALFEDAMPFITIILNERLPEVMQSLGGLGESIGRLLEAFGVNVPSVGGIIGFLQGIIDSAIWLIDTGAGVIDWISDLKDAIATGPIGEALAGFLDKVAGFVQSVKDSLPMVAEKMGALQEKLSEIADLVVPVILDNLGGIIENLGEIWDQHGEAIMGALSWIARLAAVTGLGAVTLITGVAGALTDLAAGDTPAAMDRMSTSLETFADSAASLEGTDWDAIVATWQTNFDLLEIIVRNWALVVSPIISNAMQHGFDAILEPAHSTGYYIGANIRRGYDDWQAEGGLGAIWETLVANTVTGIAAAPDVASQIGEAVRLKLGEAWLTWHDLVDPILAGILAGMKIVGKEVIDGLIAGMNANKDKVTTALKGIVDAAILAVKKLLGLASPSKVFAGFGEQINAGLAKGIKASVQLPEQAMALAVRHTIEPASRQRMVPAAAAAAAAGATDNSRTINLGQVNNNDGADAASFDLMMRDWLGA